MQNFHFAADAAWRVLLVGLVMGAGLPAIFALGIRSLAQGAARGTPNGAPAGAHAIGATGTTATGNSAATVLGYVCFALVLAAIALGLLYIVVTGQGKELSFTHVYPTIVPKG